MQLILIRHYKTEFNASGSIMGWGDSPRAEDWQEDVLAVEQALRQHSARPDLVISSSLDRSRRTAEFFAHRFRASVQREDPAFNEVNYGDLYGQSKKWVAEHYPEHKRDPDFVYPGGESFATMQARAVTGALDLAIAPEGYSVLCVAHAGVIRALVSHFLELDFALQLRRKVSHRYVGVLSLRGDVCVGYDEWGQHSGFVTDEAVALPFIRQSA